MTKGKRDQKQEGSEVTTFPVPFALGEIKENITVTTNTPSKPSKEQIINQAFKFHSQENIAKAAKYYQYFIDQGFSDHRVFSNYGVVLKSLGKLQEAELYTRKAIEIKSDYAEAYSNLGNILSAHGNLQEAEISQRKAIEIKPDFANAYSNLGTILKDLGKLKDAELSYRKAIEINPDYADAHFNLGVILKDLGKLKDAELSYRKAIEINPNFVHAYSNLGNILNDLGNLKKAELSYRKAIEIKPDYADAHSNLGVLLHDLGKLKEAELSFIHAIKINPEFKEAYSNLGQTLKALGRSKEAYNQFKKCVELDPTDLAFNMQAKLYISPIQESQLQIERERKELNKQISLIGDNNNIIYKNSRLPKSIDFIFYLAYQNFSNDKEILENIANNISKKDRILNTNFNIDDRIKESISRKKIRLGICSNFLYDHSVTRCFLNIIEDLAKSGIEIIIFRGKNDNSDKKTDHIISIATEIITLPESLERSCEIVLVSSIDILLYLDIGMSVKTYFMSLSRLALVQVLNGGHPQTSGSQNMDYYITSNREEIKNSDKFFSERLIRMTRLPVNYDIPKIVNSTFKVSSLNISEDDFIIGLPHTLYKYHPDFDEILDKVLEGIPHARLLFFEGKKHLLNVLLSRWKQNSKHILSRLIICPRVNFDDYLTISKRFDIVLDTIYFGMGNTFFQAMAFGKPVVTLLPDKPKGGGVAAGYRQMGILNPPIAKSHSEYILVCKKLAFDNSYRENISNQILSKAKDRLFNDQSIYKEYICFFQKALEAAYKKELLPKNWKPIK